ncbi:superoxide dismutase [Geobacillus genomosp. 3]|uniref:superoxide dismutase n=1 Tax=Geobacillus genomosp. 3 TaxID=1921421 RepID=S5Z6V7_GEOG3|nr:superoxide dismutase [Geobacillus genomosp. 3]AGT32602.2 superoxide dismutase [Geobacillus genomosp. 3]
MDDQMRFAQYAAGVNEWGEKVKHVLALRGASTDGASSLLQFIAEHDGAWTEEAVRELMRFVDDVYAAALRHYALEAAEWGKQVELALSARGVAEDVGLSSLLAYIEEHGDEWTETEIDELQRLVDDVYARAVRLADSSADGQEEDLSRREEGAVSPEQEGDDDGRAIVEGVTKHEGDIEQEPAVAVERAEPVISPSVDSPGGEQPHKADAADSEQQRAIPPGKHVLPPLPYSYDALEPHISEEIMRLHHTKHHQSYVDGLNKAERMMAEARRTNNFELLKHWEREAAFNGSGHYLHTIFWHNMHPEGGGEPRGELRAQMERDFGSFAAFRRHFTEAAKSAEGVGWALLVWAPRAHRLEILQAEKHQLMAQWDVIPLLVLDVWEHAYYLQYKNDRGAYIEHWWNVVNWRNVEARFVEARKLRWQPF